MKLHLKTSEVLQLGSSYEKQFQKLSAPVTELLIYSQIYTRFMSSLYTFSLRTTLPYKLKMFNQVFNLFQCGPGGFIVSPAVCFSRAQLF